jgi:hypothetical protein
MKRRAASVEDFDVERRRTALGVGGWLPLDHEAGLRNEAAGVVVGRCHRQHTHRNALLRKSERC